MAVFIRNDQSRRNISYKVPALVVVVIKAFFGDGGLLGLDGLCLRLYSLGSAAHKLRTWRDKLSSPRLPRFVRP